MPWPVIRKEDPRLEQYLPYNIDDTARNDQMVEIALVVQSARYRTQRELEKELYRPDPRNI